MLVSQLVVASLLVAAKHPLQQWKLLQCPLRLLTQVLNQRASVASFRPVLFTFAEMRNVNALITFQA